MLYTLCMSTLLELIDAEIATFLQARAALAATPAPATGKKKPGRPAKAATVPAALGAKPKRGLTPEGRARISAALKARWAAKKKAAAK